ncbi:hypothetical protein M885DRAFT_618181 [Pelagophyceae sp. CCMP2097]|nr:hypothetical protein M885DRAFT_618181 [Pelagophyceae sp. CCMP2097]
MHRSARLVVEISSPTPTGALLALAAVRRTHAAHASALGALKRAFGADLDQLTTIRRALQGDRAAMMQQVDEKLARGSLAMSRIKETRERRGGGSESTM